MDNLMTCEVSALPRGLSPKPEPISPAVGSLAPNSCDKKTHIDNLFHSYVQSSIYTCPVLSTLSFDNKLAPMAMATA